MFRTPELGLALNQTESRPPPSDLGIGIPQGWSAIPTYKALLFLDMGVGGPQESTHCYSDIICIVMPFLNKKATAVF